MKWYNFIMLKINKNFILIILFILIISFFGLSYFYKKQKNNLENNNQQNLYQCFEKKSGDKIRKIKIKVINLKNAKKIAVAGEDIFQDENSQQKYYFAGLKEDNLLTVFGNSDKRNEGQELWERLYKITEDGIIEGNVKPYYQTSKQFKKIVHTVPNKKQVTFNEINLIPKVKCE